MYVLGWFCCILILFQKANYSYLVFTKICKNLLRIILDIEPLSLAETFLFVFFHII